MKMDIKKIGVNRESSVGMVTRARAGRSAELGIFLFSTASRPALGPKLYIQWVPEALSSGAKRLNHKNDHSPPSSTEVKNAWSYISTPQYVFMAWCLIKPLIYLHGVVLS